MTRFIPQKHALTSALDDRLAQRKLLYFATYFAGMIAIQIMHLAMDDIKLTVQLSLGITAGFAYSYFLAQRWRALTTYVISGLAVAVSVYYLLQLQRDPNMYGSYLGILLGVLMVLLAFKAFSPSDHRFILMVCVIFLLFSSVASYDLKFMMLLPVFLVCAGSALYIAHQIEIALRVSMVDPDNPSPQFKIGFDFVSVLVKAVVGIIILSALAYIFTPHSSSQNRRLVLNTAPQVDEEDTKSRPDEQDNQQNQPGQKQPGQAEIGLSEDMDLTSTGELSADPRPVLLLKSHLPGYLRAKVYDVYTGSGWVESAWMDSKAGSGLVVLPELSTELPHPLRVPLFDFPSPEEAESLAKRFSAKVVENNIYSDNHVEDIAYDVVRQEIQLLEEHPAIYLALYQPYQLGNISQTRQSEPVDEPYENPGGIISAAGRELIHPKGFTYTVYSLQPRAGSAQLKQVFSNGPAPLVERYTQLPIVERPAAEALQKLGIEAESYRPVSARLRNFARGLVAPLEDKAAAGASVSTWDKVQAIYDYLLDPENLTYARDFKPTNGEQEICETFLFNTREGYCRHFATAMAVLCRLNGIPARLVTGYAPGTFSIVDNGYIYRASNAHAWVEIYFDGYGWITFDPTPAGQAAQNRKEATQWFHQAINFLQDLFVIDPAGTQQMIITALKQLWELAKEHGLATGLGAVGVALVLTLVLLLRRLPRQGGKHRLVPENEAVASYLHICYELARLGCHLGSAETPRRFMQRAAEECTPLAEQLSALIPAYERAAYSRAGADAESLEAAAAASSVVAAYVREELKNRRKQRK
jgi:transglutaminase-like putative cysteine protease